MTPLRILASAIAGRATDVVVADPGARTWTDGTTIFLEEDVPAADQLRLLGVQATLLAGGSLDRDVLDELGRSRALAQRYLSIEGHRALAANEAVLPPILRALIEPGRAEGLGSAMDSLSRARKQRTTEPPWVFGTIDPRRIRPPGTSAETVSLPTSGTRTSGSDTVDIVSLEELDDDARGFDIGNLLTSPVGGGGPIGKLLSRLFEPSRRRGGGGPPGADAPTHLSTRPGAGTTVVAAASPAPFDVVAGPATPTSHSYPEWDMRAGRYRMDWCSVVEDDAPMGASSTVDLPDTRTLRRVLAPLGLGLTPCRRQKQGDDVDIDAVVEARVDLAAGSPHDDDLYIESLRRRRDLSVLVLLDVSGSAGEPGASGRTVHEHQQEAAAAIAGALHELGDRVALYAFSSHGRKAVRVSAVKRFDETLGGEALRRLHGLTPGAYTRVGAAIRHGTAVLATRGGTPRRLLVVLSDGFAYDHGYEGPYGEADARRALVEARRQGIGCLCLSVGAITGPAALRRVFGSTAHAAVPAADRLPALVGPLFESALSSAEVHRHRFLRRERTRERLEIERGTR